jgi:hypothetical protein
MVRAALVWMLLVPGVAACGSRRPEARPVAEAVIPADAGLADAGFPDAGMDAGPIGLIPTDAGLLEIGVAPCQVVIARLLACPGVPEDSKRQMAEAARHFRDEAAASSAARESLASRCLEMARMTEPILLQLGC